MAFPMPEIAVPLVSLNIKISAGFAKDGKSTCSSGNIVFLLNLLFKLI